MVACGDSKPTGSPTDKPTTLPTVQAKTIQAPATYKTGATSTILKVLVDHFIASPNGQKYGEVMTMIGKHDGEHAYNALVAQGATLTLSLTGDKLTTTTSMNSSGVLISEATVYTIAPAGTIIPTSTIFDGVSTIQDMDGSTLHGAVPLTALDAIKMKTIVDELKKLTTIESKVGTSRVYYYPSTALDSAIAALADTDVKEFEQPVSTDLDGLLAQADKNLVGFYIDGSTGTQAFSSVTRANGKTTVTYLFTITL